MENIERVIIGQGSVPVPVIGDGYDIPRKCLPFPAIVEEACQMPNLCHIKFKSVGLKIHGELEIEGILSDWMQKGAAIAIDPVNMVISKRPQ
jgi:hypothetical protein